jgi:hypothetical protein
MHIGKRAVLAFSAIALLSFTSLSVSGDEVCPNKLGGGEVKDGKYQFQFKSWEWSKAWELNREVRYVFCFCVRNNSQFPIYIDWQGSNLSGFVPPIRISTSMTIMPRMHMTK